MKELEELVKNPLPRVKIFPNADDPKIWKVLMIGPEGSSYHYGVYLLFV